jgi:hypothetical protein
MFYVGFSSSAESHRRVRFSFGKPPTIRPRKSNICFKFAYLSSEIQIELICLLASTLRKKLLSDVKKNRYYGVLIDSRPDLGHREQLSEVIRFVDVDYVTKKAVIKESFLEFFFCFFLTFGLQRCG